MLLKFNGGDMLNASIVDVSTGKIAYDIITAIDISPHNPPSNESDTLLDMKSRAGDPASPIRRTWVYGPSGRILAEVGWIGRRPLEFVLGDEKIGGLTELFGSSTVRFLPKLLVLPARFDTELTWTATANTLALFDFDSEENRGRFYPASFHIRDRFVPSHIPGLGHNYLEFDNHLLASPAEIIVSFLMMEILRRGRFSMTPYMFHRTKSSQLHAALFDKIKGHSV